MPLYILWPAVPRLDRDPVHRHTQAAHHPELFGDAFSIFLLRQFFLTIPKELTDAVRVDGGGHLQILRRVIILLPKPALAAVALFNFIYSWNDFYGPLVYLAGNTTRRRSRSRSASFPRCTTSTGT